MNLSGVLEILHDLTSYQELSARYQSGDKQSPLGLPPNTRVPVLAGLLSDLDRPALLVTGRVDAVPAWIQAFEAWLPDQFDLVRFPEPTPLPYERGPWSELSRNRRLAVLARLMKNQHPLLPKNEDPFLIVTSARALLHKTLPRRRFASFTRIVRVGQIVKMMSLLEDWQSAGYEAVTVVESPGQFSRRGGILDIYPVGAIYPARIEFFGDEVETLRSFDPATQRSLDLTDERQEYVVIPPAREMVPGDVRELGKKLAKLTKADEQEFPGWWDDVADLAVNYRPI
jgi:transcription-repair coupling factor (superfamily II helicase)